jgi:ABC-type dipeptide/oligopeptide/nickel transport system permease subunit
MAGVTLQKKSEMQRSDRERDWAMQAQTELKREAQGYWASAFHALRRDKLTLAAIGVLLTLTILCLPLAGPITNALGVDPSYTDLMVSFEGPSKEHLLGTDQVGRDQLARLLYGGRVSLGVSFFAAIIIMSLGVAVGMIAGFYGGIVDDLIIWFITTMNSIPFILLLLIVSLLFKPNAATLTVFIGLMSWTGVSRIVRGQVIQARELDYVLAARAVGARTVAIVVRHILPNVVPIVIIVGVQIIGGVILVESALSFLGLGIQPPTATWGNMLTKAQSYFYLGPHLVVWPGVLITITVLCLYVIGDGLRDALDPTMRGMR